MPTLAPRAASVFGAATAGERAFLKLPRGVVAVAPAARGEMTQDKLGHRVVARKTSAPPAPMRVRSGFDVKIRESVANASVVVPRHGNKEVLFTRGTGRSGTVPAGKDDAVILTAKRRRPEEPSAEEAAAKRRKSSSSSNPAPRAAHQRMAVPVAKQQQRAAPTTAQSPISKLIEKGKEALKKRRLEEIARAREKFRRELLEVEKAAIPDETIYPEDLEELGLTVFQYAVTPTREQALRSDG